MKIRRRMVENVRSIERADLELAPLTILYGPNGAGKSSLLYAPLGLRNIALSPNAPPSAFWNCGFVSSGEFRAGDFGHTPGREIAIGVMVSVPEGTLMRGKRPPALGYRVRPGTLWAQKAFRLFDTDQPGIRPASKLLRRLLWDPAKSRTPRPSFKTNAPRMDRIPEEDRYLVTLYREAGADVLITTDEQLLSRIREAQAPVRALSLPEWIAIYFSGSPSR